MYGLVLYVVKGGSDLEYYQFKKRFKKKYVPLFLNPVKRIKKDHFQSEIQKGHSHQPPVS